MVLAWENGGESRSPRSRLIGDYTTLDRPEESALSSKNAVDADNCAELIYLLQIPAKKITEVCQHPKPIESQRHHPQNFNSQQMFTPKWSFSDNNFLSPKDLMYSSRTRVKIGEDWDPSQIQHKHVIKTDCRKRISLNFEPTMGRSSTLVRVTYDKQPSMASTPFIPLKSQSFGNLRLEQRNFEEPPALNHQLKSSGKGRSVEALSKGYHSSIEIDRTGRSQLERSNAYLVGSFKPSRTKAKWIGSDSDSQYENHSIWSNSFSHVSRPPCFKRMIKSTTLPPPRSRMSNLNERPVLSIPEEPFNHRLNGRLAILPMIAVKRLKRFSLSPRDSESCPKSAMVLTKRMLVTDKDQEVFEISLFSDESYEPGDLIAVKPQNVPSKVNKLLWHYGIRDRSEYFCLTGAVSVFSEPTTFDAAFAQIVDLSAPVPVDFLVALESEIGCLPEVLNAKALVPYNNRKSATECKRPDICEVIEILRQNKKRLPSLELLLIHLPKIRSRKYYITSAGNGVISFSFKPRKIDDCCFGLCSDYLISLKSRDFVTATVVPGSNFNLPPQPEVPIILLVGDLGILTVRSILESRRLNKIKNRLFLLYKVREGTPVLYQEEIYARRADRVLTELIVTTERTRKVLDFLESNVHWQQLITHAVQQGGHIYVSGKVSFCKQMRKFIQSMTENLSDLNNDFYHEESGCYSCETFEIL